MAHWLCRRRANMGTGIVGFLFERFRFPIAPLVPGVMLGPPGDSAFMTTMISYSDDWTIFFTRPVSGPVTAVAIITRVYPVFHRMRQTHRVRTPS